MARIVVFILYLCARMDEKKKIVFIANPISGTQSKKQVIQRIQKCIDTEKYTYEVARTEYAGHATLLTAKAVEEGAAIVVAIGGDGTINEVARALLHTNVALGIIPCGSGNGLARHLQIPMNVEKAIEILNQGNISCVDYGKINHIPFFCTCGVGFDAFVSLKFSKSEKRGPLTYLENMLHEFLSYKPETYEIEVEHGTLTYKAFLIACANASQYGNNVYIAPDASLDDGLMDVTIIEPFTVLDIPALAYQMFTKTLAQNSRIKTFKCKQIQIHRPNEGVIHFDGDPTEAGKDLYVEIVPKGIYMVTNKQWKQETGPMSLVQIFSDYYQEINDLNKLILKEVTGLNKQILQKISNTNLIKEPKKLTEYRLKMEQKVQEQKSKIGGKKSAKNGKLSKDESSKDESDED